MKGKKSVVARPRCVGAAARTSGPIRSIVFACDAGMGSSAMGASVLRKKIQAAGFGDVTVVNKAISNLTDTYDLVVTHQDLTDRAQQKTPSAIHVSVDNFMNSPRYDEIVELIGAGQRRRGCRAPVPQSCRASAGGRPTRPVDECSRRLDRARRHGHRPDAAITRPAGCWSPPARSTRPTSTRCTSARSRCRPTWATGWRSRTAPTRPSRRSAGPAISFVRYAEPDRLERQAGRVRRRHRRCGQRPPGAAVPDRRGVPGHGPGGPAPRRPAPPRRSRRCSSAVGPTASSRMSAVDSDSRQSRIVEFARTRGRVEVAALAEELDVATETIRRDLKVLAGRRLLKRVHGGAIPLETAAFESDRRIPQPGGSGAKAPDRGRGRRSCCTAPKRCTWTRDSPRG